MLLRSPWGAIGILLAACMLSACGGGGGASAPAPAAPTYTHQVLVQPEDRIVTNDPGFNTSILITREPDAVKSVAWQARQPGDIILTLGWTREAGFVDTDIYLAEAKKHPRMRYAYLYDEVFWTGRAVEIGLNEAAIHTAARKARAAGLKTVVSILPDVILAGNFAMTDINAIDVMAIDVYPSGRINQPVVGCNFSANHLTNLLYCSSQMLRAKGFTGEVWYVSQAFGDNAYTAAQLRAMLELQAQTIAQAPSFGITGYVPFGLYFGPIERARETALSPLHGTDLEPLVRPPR